ncbi:DUF1641 domain-containing protein [Halorubrum sp. SS7]|uniref:DUF1641 domain-containing protein n=1 Tax=Halorubrum sp. SS7 TaxID=2518119 RepID=UPI0010F650BB|nr:DUF1641 domain-containing protein [Halorubrum sp. SS7]TKX56767.1 DUF1641 domain-containing protein [Halorubrum sp. SS7]
MSETEAPESTDLEAAIAENPEAVAAFVERLDAVNELLDVLALGEGALSDEMVRELSATGATLAESADGLATDETAALAEAVGENGDDLRAALDTLLELQRSGTLDELAEVAEVGSLATAALDDEMVASLAGTGAALGEVAQTAADDDTRDGVETLLKGVGEAEREPPERVGAVGLLRGVRDPEVQYGLGYLLAVASAIGRERAGRGESE